MTNLQWLIYVTILSSSYHALKSEASQTDHKLRPSLKFSFESQRVTHNEIHHYLLVYKVI